MNEAPALSGLPEAERLGDPRHSQPDYPIIYVTRTENISQQSMDALWDLLDEYQRNRIRLLLLPSRRREATVAHGLLRLIVGASLSIAPASIKFAAPRPGEKPVLMSGAFDGIDANITHCPQLAGCAVGMNCDIGIDAEDLDRRVPTEPATAWPFAPDEIDWLACQPSTEVKSAILHLWTLKEAIVKAEGTGLTRDLTTFSVLPSPARIVSLPPDMGAVSDWSLFQTIHRSRHVVATAIRQPSRAVAAPSIRSRMSEL